MGIGSLFNLAMPDGVNLRCTISVEMNGQDTVGFLPNYTRLFIVSLETTCGHLRPGSQEE